MTNIISFPGLGIDEIRINPVAFNLFGKNVMWYGIIITTGIIAGFLYALYRSKFEKIKSEDIYDLAIVLIILAIIGARTYYVATTWNDSKHNYIGKSIWDTLYNIVAIWEGGIAIYGAIIGGAVAIVLFSRVKKLPMLKIFDLVSPGVMLGQIIGRWGNFMNAEAFGYDTTLPWRMGVMKQYTSGTIYDYGFVHPTFLYESLWNLVGFIIINIFYKKKKYDGQILLMYLTWYGLGRMFIEGLRTDSLWIFGGAIRISQAVGFICFVAGTVLLMVLSVKYKNTNASLNGHMSGEAVECSRINDDEAISEAENKDADEKTKEGEKEDGKDN